MAHCDLKKKKNKKISKKTICKHTLWFPSVPWDLQVKRRQLWDFTKFNAIWFILQLWQPSSATGQQGLQGTNKESLENSTRIFEMYQSLQQVCKSQWCQIYFCHFARPASLLFPFHGLFGLHLSSIVPFLLIYVLNLLLSIKKPQKQKQNKTNILAGCSK